MTTLLVVLLAVAGVIIWSISKELDRVKEDYEQATFAAWRLMMLATNGDELHDRMKGFVIDGHCIAATGDRISDENKRVMRVNTGILNLSEGMSWSEASEKYRAMLKGMGL